MSYNPSFLTSFIPPRCISNQTYSEFSYTLYLSNRVYISLKSQRTIFHALLDIVQNYQDKKKEELGIADMDAINVYKSVISDILNSMYGNLFQTNRAASTKINKVLQAKLNSDVERLGIKILTACLSIQRQINLLTYSKINPEEILYIDDKNSAPKIEQLSSDDSNSTSTSSVNNENNMREWSEGATVICRICEKEVPISMIETHSTSCAIAYETSKSMKTTEDQMRKLQALAQQTVLFCEWPGDEINAKMTVIPVLHMVALLDRAIAVDPQSPGSESELDEICNNLATFSFLINSIPDTILKRAIQLSNEKATTSRNYADAIKLVQETTNDKDTEIKETTIADFTFIRRISSGAYAKVYLTRKKQTGDLSATKVIKKNSLQQKNGYQRVMVEKNILSDVSNPFMTRFCMYSFDFSLIFILILLL